MRYILNISFSNRMVNNVSNIVERFKTKKEAIKYSKLIDDTVEQALIKDNVTGKVEWIRKF